MGRRRHRWLAAAMSAVLVASCGDAPDDVGATLSDRSDAGAAPAARDGEEPATAVVPRASPAAPEPAAVPGPRVRFGRTLEEWIALLRSSDAREADAAAAAIAAFGKDAVPALIEEIRRIEGSRPLDGAAWFAAAHAIERLGDVATPDLAALLRPGEPLLCDALDFLAETAPEWSAGPQAREIVLAVQGLRDGADDDLRVRIDRCLQAAGPGLAALTDEIGALLASDDPDAVVRGLRLAGSAGPAAASLAPAVAALLAQPELQDTALFTLQAMGPGVPEGQCEDLVALVLTVPTRRSMALDVLALWAERSPSAADVLAASLTHADGDVREATAEALSHAPAAARKLLPTLVAAATADPGRLDAWRGVFEAIGPESGRALEPMFREIAVAPQERACALLSAVQRCDLARTGLLPYVIAALRNQNARGLALEVLQRQERPPTAAIPALAALLASEDLYTRTTLIGLLDRLAPEAPGAVPSLLPLLDDEDEQIRLSAAVYLREHEPVPLTTLLPRLGSADEFTRRVAIEAMDGRDAACVPVLLECLADESSWVSGAAADALGRTTGPLPRLSAEQIEVLLDADVGDLLARSESGISVCVDRQIARLRSGTESVHQHGARVLGSLGTAGARAAPALRALLDADDRPQSPNVLPEVLRALVAVTADRASLLPDVRRWEQAGRVGPDTARSVLASLGAAGLAGLAELVHPAIATQRSELVAAVAAAGDEGRAELLRIAAAEDEPGRATCVRVVAEACPGDAPPVLEAALRDPAPAIRAAAAEAFGDLARAGGDATSAAAGVVVLLRDPDSVVRAAAARAVGARGRAAASAAPALRALLDDPFPEVRVAAAGAVWRTTGEGAVVVGALSESIRGFALPSGQDRGMEAAAYVAEIGPAASPVVPDLAWMLDRTDEVTVRAALLRALAAIGPESVRAIDAVRRDLRREIRFGARWGDPTLLRAAMAVVEAIGPPAAAAAPEVRLLLDEGAPEVREAARAAMRAIEGRSR